MTPRRILCACAVALLTCVILSSVAVSGLAQSAAPPLVRLAAVPDRGAVVGQQIVLRLDTLTADGRALLESIPPIDVAGGYILRVEAQGTRIEETVDGTPYLGTRYEWLLYPQRDGTLQVPAVTLHMRVLSDSGQVVRRESAETPTLTVSVERPPGTEGIDGLVATSRLDAEQAWEPAGAESTVGGAITRHIVLRADGVAGMAFAPLPHDAPAGVRVYVSQPLVDDAVNRSTLTAGSRTETLTYVFEAPGQVALPPIEIPWWNTTTRGLETARLAGMVVTVTAATGARNAAVQRARWPLVLAAVAGLVAVSLGVRRLLAGRSRGMQQPAVPDEAELFRRFRAAARTGDARATLAALMRWLDVAALADGPAQLAFVLAAHGDAEMGAQADALVRSALRSNGDMWDPAALQRSMTRLRKCVLHRGHGTPPPSPLPRTLNPVPPVPARQP